MPSYDIHFKTSARKELAALGDSIALRVLQKIEALVNEPRPNGCKKLRGARIFGGYALAIILSFTELMIALRKSPSSEFAIDGKFMTNLDRDRPAARRGKADFPGADCDGRFWVAATHSDPPVAVISLGRTHTFPIP